MQCVFVKRDGSQCRATALPGATLCLFHHPDHARRRAAARRRGGISRSRPRTLPEDAPDLPLKTAGEVAAALGSTINAVRRGQLDARIANSIGVLAGVLLKALSAGDLEERVALLEAECQARRLGSGRRAT
jgi:hypothetical protein